MSVTRMITRLLQKTLLVSPLLLGGCSTFPSGTDTTAPPAAETRAQGTRMAEAPFMPDAIQQGKRLPFPAWSALLAAPRVIIAGEQHDQYQDHRVQLEVLRTLYRQNPALAIGVEWFQQPVQGVIDAYLAGQITETTLLQRSGYYQRWGYDYRMLRPIMAFARTHHLPVLALNAPQELTRKIGRGGLAALTPAERRQLPAAITPADNAYRQYLQTVFARHGGHGQFEHFLTVQRVWEETMSANAVRYLQQHPGQRLLILAGRGHMSQGRGIPADIRRRLPQTNLLTLITETPEEQETSPQGPAQTGPVTADLQVLAEPMQLPASGKLGAWLMSDVRGVSIRGLVSGGAAEKAGLKDGDYLTQINGGPVTDKGDILQVVAMSPPGTPVTLQLKRQIPHRKQPALQTIRVILE
ncbi:MAG: ChaN family lipoprotein [Thiothrix sp.]|nr:ChaN family lipoprotein [Thiothrix sp.]